jgi:hypothetical protein
MAYYRLYQLHGAQNEVEGFEEFEASDDVEAIARAEGFRRVNPMELWSEHRKVHRWDGIFAGNSERPPSASR